MGADKPSCQAKTSQAPPTPQPQDLSQSKPQICIYFFKPLNVFSMCECGRACAPLRARLCYLRSSQTESFTPGGSLVPPLGRTRSVYSHANIINIADDRGLKWGDVALRRRQTPVSLAHTRDASLRSRWMRRTRAPERPCHPGEFPLARSRFRRSK